MSTVNTAVAGTKRKRSELGQSALIGLASDFLGEDKKGPFAELFPLTHEERNERVLGLDADVGDLFADPITLSCLFGPDLSEAATPVIRAPRPITLDTAGGGEKKIHVCPVPSCNKEFRDRSGLRKHKKAKHSFNCPHDTCGKVFPTLDNMLAHMHEHATQ